MPGSSTTPDHQGARVCAPVCVAFHLRNGVGTRDMNLYGAQWLAYVLPYRRFAAALTGDNARLRANVDRYYFIVSVSHRLLVAGLPAHCERFCTLSANAAYQKQMMRLARGDVRISFRAPIASQEVVPRLRAYDFGCPVAVD